MYATSTVSESYRANEDFVRELIRRFGRYTRRKPKRAYELLLRLLSPGEVRRIVRLESGLMYYINPFTHIGRHILEPGGYEAQNLEMFSQHIKRGEVVVDVGANEGYFTAFFGLLVGQQGKVIAVEPQARLRDFIEINCRLNGLCNFAIFQKALGPADAKDAYLALYSSINTGQSSLVTDYHSTTGYQKVSFITIEEIMQQCGVDVINMVKIDTEGFEAEIIPALLGAVKRGAIEKIFVDYHEAILSSRGLSSQALDELLINAGMIRAGEAQALSGYVLYEQSPQKNSVMARSRKR